MILETFVLKVFEKKESFTSFDLNTFDLTTIDTTIVVYFLFLFIYAFGAAKLSWSLSRHSGTSYFVSVMYAIIAFMFSSAYYPIYAYFYNPLNKLKH